MEKKELKKLNRRELLELLLEQSRGLESVQAEAERMRAQRDSRELAGTEAGSIADAALRVNNVFQDAQAAAAQYLENVQSLSGRQYQLCEQMLADTTAKCAAMEAETQAKCGRMVQEAEAQAQKYWDTAAANIRNLIDQTPGLGELLEAYKAR